jgi:hypothetical protein
MANLDDDPIVARMKGKLPGWLVGYIDTPAAEPPAEPGFERAGLLRIPRPKTEAIRRISKARLSDASPSFQGGFALPASFVYNPSILASQGEPAKDLTAWAGPLPSPSASRLKRRRP